MNQIPNVSESLLALDCIYFLRRVWVFLEIQETPECHFQSIYSVGRGCGKMILSLLVISESVPVAKQLPFLSRLVKENRMFEQMGRAVVGFQLWSDFIETSGFHMKTNIDGRNLIII